MRTILQQFNSLTVSQKHTIKILSYLLILCTLSVSVMANTVVNNRAIETMKLEQNAMRSAENIKNIKNSPIYKNKEMATLLVVKL